MNIRTDRLRKSATDTMLFGVAGGMAEYFDIDPTLVRIAWVLLVIVSAGLALIAYLILAIIMPKRASTPTSEVNAQEIGPEDDTRPAGRLWARGSTLFGAVLIGLGVLFLLSNLGFLYWWRWDVFWPLLIIGVGVALLVGHLVGRDDG